MDHTIKLKILPVVAASCLAERLNKAAILKHLNTVDSEHKLVFLASQEYIGYFNQFSQRAAVHVLMVR